MLSVSSYLVVGRRVTPMIYRQVSVKWPKWIAVEISSCLGRSGSACRQSAGPKLCVGMARSSVWVLALSVSSYLVRGRRVTPMIYRQVSVKWPKWIAVEISSCLGCSGSACRQAAATRLGVGMARASVQVLPLSVLSYLVRGRRVTQMIYRQVSVKWPKWIAVGPLDQQLAWSLWLGLVWRAGPGAAVVRFIVSCPWPARHTNNIPPSKCEMAKVNCCRPIRPTVGLVPLARPASKLQPPNLAWARPEHWPRCCRCLFHRILSWAGVSHQWSTAK